ncbi:hypothetical protein TELCIR_10289 [Teladorsagia circumcincta]|uniref:Uncharacterized protein n=1 Tax=Teladorsagia circumcincta TaxID=45464 RepID=A0A2G9UCI4_TELCI|nr:hypothetical protein TELCIR_10289 [Teladorsagia circumcincta]
MHFYRRPIELLTCHGFGSNPIMGRRTASIDFYGCDTVFNV